MKNKLEVGMYARYNGRIGKIKYICDCEQCKARGYLEPVIEYIHKEDEYVSCYYKNDLKASHNIMDLIEYMDLLVIENELKDIDNRELHFFNPVRCDGFKTFEDGKHCMIINMDHIIPIKNIRVYQVLTHELFESMSYKVGD